MTHWIDGARVEGTSGRSGPVFDPATGRQTKTVDLASVEEVVVNEEAVDNGAKPLLIHADTKAEKTATAG